MSELMVLLQALLLIAGWLLFLRAQTELRAQAARQSLTGELEELRQTIDALLHKLAEDAARAEARIEARLRELERYTAQIAPALLIPTALPKSHAMYLPSRFRA
jgi:Tfp pilus assembly protein PilN